jgi:Leucine-rich repeat (LRR) protein
MQQIDERVVVTRDMCIAALKQHGVRIGIDPTALIQKQTHLHLNGHKPPIEVLVDFKALGFKALEVLYLYENSIQSSSMQLLSSISSTLKHLYLSNNDLDSLEGLREGKFDSLTKLYVQSNQISHLIGLESMKNLEELHLSNQRLSPDSPGLTFDLRTKISLPMLKVLTANDCLITDESAAGLPQLSSLKKLELKNNRLVVVESIETVLRGAARLQSLDLAGNPFATSKTAPIRYRDAVILMSSDSLQSLDGVEITEKQRSFLLNLNIMRLKKEMAAAAAEGGGEQ